MDLETPYPEGLRGFDGCMDARPTINHQGHVAVTLRDDEAAAVYVYEPVADEWVVASEPFSDAQWVMTRGFNGIFVSTVHGSQDTHCRQEVWPEASEDVPLRGTHMQVMHLTNDGWHPLVTEPVGFSVAETGRCLGLTSANHEDNRITLLDLSDPRQTQQTTLPIGGRISWFRPR